MSDAEIQASIETILATKTPLYSLLGLNEVDYRWQATKMVKSAIATYEPRAVVTGVEFNGGLRVRWQPVTTRESLRSETYPDTSAMTPQDAAEYLLEYALAGFLGKNELDGIEDAIREAINSDSRLKVLTTRGFSRSEGTSAEVEVQVRSLVKILRYDGISQYDGTWQYG